MDSVVSWSCASLSSSIVQWTPPDQKIDEVIELSSDFSVVSWGSTPVQKENGATGHSYDESDFSVVSWSSPNAFKPETPSRIQGGLKRKQSAVAVAKKKICFDEVSEGKVLL